MTGQGLFAPAPAAALSSKQDSNLHEFDFLSDDNSSFADDDSSSVSSSTAASSAVRRSGSRESNSSAAVQAPTSLQALA
jgi:hypothetical protein